MHSLTEGALDNIMNGVDVEKPVLQILGHKKLGSSNSGDRYRLLISDGIRINSFTMLATQLNHMISDDILTEYSICQINRYAISTVNSSGKQKRVMVILNLDLKVPGSEVGHRIGNPTQGENAEGESSSSAQPPQSGQSASSGGGFPTKNVKPAQTPKYTGSTSEISTTPIVALSPFQNRWVIKVRVTSKSDIRTWSNSRGEGKLFSMDLLDESGEIRCTAFRDQCDKFFDMIQIGNVYYISRCQLKPANKQFNTLKNDYEMTLTSESEIIPCQDESDIPTVQYDFIPIDQIMNKNKNDIVDIIGIVKSSSAVQMITSRQTGRELRKRDIDILDESNTMVCFTLWGNQADDFPNGENLLVAIKAARVGEFNGGKNISAISSTNVTVDPDIPEAHRLRGWLNSSGGNVEATSISKSFGNAAGSATGPWITFKEAKDMDLGGSTNADIYVVKATVNMIRTENILYKSCPTEGCKKKLVDHSNQMYRCEKCDREYPNFKYRLLVNISMVDWTENRWVTAFNDEAEKLLGIPASELGELQDNDNDEFMERVADSTFKSFIFKLRAKTESFNDNPRSRSSCLSVDPVNWKVYNQHLLNKIKEIVGMEKA